VSRCPTPVTISIASPDAEDGRRVLRAYFADLVSRYHRRPATDEEIDAALAEEPSDDLTLPRGLFLLAYREQEVIGCGGLRLLPADLGEVTRLFVVPGARGQGLGALLLDELEGAARARGLSRLRLDTRGDLVEARRLYARQGYTEVPPFSAGPYAEHWFAKALD
jgi:GNAT superfamily N-acetyltransferase